MKQASLYLSSVSVWNGIRPQWEVDHIQLNTLRQRQRRVCSESLRFIMNFVYLLEACLLSQSLSLNVTKNELALRIRVLCFRVLELQVYVITPSGAQARQTLHPMSCTELASHKKGYRKRDSVCINIKATFQVISKLVVGYYVMLSRLRQKAKKVVLQTLPSTHTGLGEVLIAMSQSAGSSRHCLYCLSPNGQTQV